MAGSLKELFQGIAEGFAPTIERGTVTNENPLTVTNSLDAKIYLSDASLIIPSGKRSRLTVGREFYFLAVNKGMTYYLLDEV